MSAPRYQPNDYCADPELFGKAPTVEWFPTTNVRDAALSRAAQLQHFYAVRIRYQAKKRNLEMNDELARIRKLDGTQNENAPRPNSLKELSGLMGTSHVRLLRTLRGAVVMRLDDIAWAEELFGSISEVPQEKAPRQS